MIPQVDQSDVVLPGQSQEEVMDAQAYAVVECVWRNR
jgi:hypothetical protein